MSINLTAQQQKQLLDLLIYVARALWDSFGKEMAADFMRWAKIKFANVDLVQSLAGMFASAETLEDFNAAAFMIVDDQCIPVKPGECVTPEGYIDANCDDVQDNK